MSGDGDSDADRLAVLETVKVRGEGVAEAEGDVMVRMGVTVDVLRYVVVGEDEAVKDMERERLGRRVGVGPGDGEMERLRVRDGLRVDDPLGVMDSERVRVAEGVVVTVWIVKVRSGVRLRVRDGVSVMTLKVNVGERVCVRGGVCDGVLESVTEVDGVNVRVDERDDVIEVDMERVGVGVSVLVGVMDADSVGVAVGGYRQTGQLTCRRTMLSPTSTIVPTAPAPPPVTLSLFVVKLALPSVLANVKIALIWGSIATASTDDA